jgi:hypothetical protein
MSSFPKTLVMSGAIALMATVAQAQEIAGSFDQLRVLITAGDAIRVTDSSGQQIRGQLLDLSPTSIGILSNGIRRELSAADVDLVTARRHGNLATGAKWGLGVGAGLGLFSLAVATSGYGCSGGCLPLIFIGGAVYGGIGAGIGVGVSALTTSQRVIFARSSDRAVTLSVAPTIGRDRQGLMLTARW